MTFRPLTWHGLYVDYYLNLKDKELMDSCN